MHVPALETHETLVGRVPDSTVVSTVLLLANKLTFTIWVWLSTQEQPNANQKPHLRGIANLLLPVPNRGWCVRQFCR